jgi:hypothetical protein
MKLQPKFFLITVLSWMLLASVAEAQCARKTFQLKDDVNVAIVAFTYVRDGNESRNLISDQVPVTPTRPQRITIEGEGEFRFVAVLGGSGKRVFGTVRNICLLTNVIITNDDSDEPMMNFQ